MIKLTKLQEHMLKSWIKSAENNQITPNEVKILDEKITGLISSIDYDKSIAYFSRVNIDEMV